MTSWSFGQDVLYMSLRAAKEFSSEYLFLSLLRVECQQSGQLMRHFCMASSQLKATCEYKIDISIITQLWLLLLHLLLPRHNAFRVTESTVTDSIATAPVIYIYNLCSCKGTT